MALGDDFGFGLVGFVHDGLGKVLGYTGALVGLKALGARLPYLYGCDVGVGGHITAVCVRGLGLGLAEVLLGDVESVLAAGRHDCGDGLLKWKSAIFSGGLSCFLSHILEGV